MVFGILTHIAPAQNIFKVWRIGNYKLIPIYTVLVGLCSSISWLIFSFLIWDFHSIIPKSISSLFGIINTFSYTYFYFRAKNGKNKGDENTQEGTLLEDKTEEKA